jgi:PKD repeat protein
MYEGGDFPYLHTPNDNLGVLGNTAQPSVAHTKLGLAYLGELAKTSSTPSGVPTADFSFTTNALTANFTDASTDSNGSIVSRSWNFGDGSSSSATNPSHTYAGNGSYNVTLTVTDNSALTANRTQQVAVSNNVLANGVAVTNLAAVAGAELVYTLSIPANSTDLKFAMQGGTGNADLYVKFGSAPTDASYDCRPFRAGSLESCSFATPQAGTWYVRIKARTTFSGVKLTPTFLAGSGSGGGGTQSYTANGPIALPDLATTDIPVNVSGRTGNAPASTPVYVNITHPRRGDLRIRLFAPDGSSYTVKPSSATDTAPNVIGTFNLNLSAEALNGTWKLRVVDTASGNAGTLNSWSITF